MCQQELVNSLNQFYVSVNTDIPPLDSNILPAFLPAEAGVLTVQPHEVCKKLLDIIHTWLTYLDPPGRHLRLCFLDFSKALDRIGYNVLIEKPLDFRTSLIPVDYKLSV